MARCPPGRLGRRLAALAALALGAGCPADDPCVEVATETCAPTYQPTFDNVFSRTLVESCGVSGRGCHAPEGAKAGLVFEDGQPDAAYAALLDGRVIPGDAGCSLIVRRLESTRSSFKMPPGSRTLSAGEQCAIEQWIAAGAER